MKAILRFTVLAMFAILTVCANAQTCSWKLIAANNHHTIAIKSDGTLWGWGNNEYGQLGDGTTINRITPVKIGTESNWINITTGYNHSYGLKSDGTLWAWGNNYYGQLGDKSYIDKVFPVKIDTSTHWVNISAGWHHGLAIKSDGTLYSWGLNSYGQLGDGTTNNRNFPFKIGSDNQWVSAVGGGSHSIGLKNNGSLWVWGNNYSGQLGDNTNLERLAPIQEPTRSIWKSVATSYDHNLGIKSDNSLWSWGSNYSGQLGDGTKINKLSAVQIGFSEWKSIAVGEDNSLAIKSDGTLWGWGSNIYGQIGDGSSVGKKNPVQVGNDNNWSKIYSGSFHSLGLKTNDTFWTWGNNEAGQLGNASIDNSYTPLQIANGNCKDNYNWIPDVNFRNALKFQYPGCFNSSDFLSIDCANTALNSTLDVSGKKITDLEGIQHFKNLQVINCSNNNLTGLPLLPPALQILNASQNCFCPSIPSKPNSFPSSGTWDVLPNKASCYAHLTLPLSPVNTEINTPTSILAGKSIYFNGINDYINVPAFSMSETPVTIEFWAKPEVSTSNKSVIFNIGSANGIIIEQPGNIENPNGFKFNYGNGGENPNFNVPEVLSWNHIAISSSGKSGTFNIYLNGALIKSGTLTNNQVSLAGLKIGASSSLGDFYKGYIHDLRIWKKIRSQTEILSSLNRFNDFSNPDLMGAWNLNEGIGNTAKDYSTRNLSGNIVGCTWGNVDNQIQYSWSPSTYLSSPNSQTVVFNTPIPNTYTYILTASKPNYCSSNQTISVVAKNNIGKDFSHPIQIGVMNPGSVYSNTQNNNLVNGFKNDVGQPSDDIFYSFTLTQNSNVRISHCNSPLSDTYMHLFNSNKTSISVNDDYGPSCQSYKASISTNLVAGTYYIASEGYNLNAGDITTDLLVQECVTLPGTNLANPIIMNNNIGSCYSFSDIKNNGACFGNDYGQPSGDIFYKFTLNSTQTVTISNCGSEISDSYMTLLDANGNYFDSNDDSPNCSGNLQSFLQRELSAGTYYIVEEGYSTNTGYIKLSFKTGINCRVEENEPISKGKIESTEAIGFNSNISLFPNPANELVTINIPGNSEDLTLFIKDISGKTIASIQTSEAQTQINTSDLTSGMYYLSFQQNNRNTNLKLQISK